MPRFLRFLHKLRLPKCSICNEPVELETAKTDQDGKAVHERVLRQQDHATKRNHTTVQSLLTQYFCSPFVLQLNTRVPFTTFQSRAYCVG